MLAILAYSRPIDLELLKKHFRTLQRYPLLFPGEPLKKGRRNFSLTFDGGSFYFYHLVYPLLVEYNLKATLSLPTQYILEKTTLPAAIRLAVPNSLIMQEGIYENKVPFCTWQEVEEMVTSGHVTVAAHSHLHCNLTFSFVDLVREVVQPKRIIETRLGKAVTTFVYPFGKSTPEIDDYVKQHYSYSLGLVSGKNRSWSQQGEPLRRILVTEKSNPFSIFNPEALAFVQRKLSDLSSVIN